MEEERRSKRRGSDELIEVPQHSKEATAGLRAEVRWSFDLIEAANRMNGKWRLAEADQSHSGSQLGAWKCGEFGP